VSWYSRRSFRPIARLASSPWLHSRRSSARLPAGQTSRSCAEECVRFGELRHLPRA
jgi:hypothetical protein